MEEPRLSDWLSEQIPSFDKREGYTPTAADEEARQLFLRIAEELIEGREAFTEGVLELTLRKFAGRHSQPLEQILRNEPNIAEAEIDRVLTVRALEGMNETVSRVVNLSKLERVKIPSKQTAQYVREAARTYMFGFFQASAAISRVALEQSLKEALGQQGIEDFVKFKELRKEAERRGILDNVTGPAAAKVASDASSVIHHRPTDAEGALNILARSRGLIVQIYKAALAQPPAPDF